MKSRIGELLKTTKYKREYIQKQLGVSANTLTSWGTGKTYPRMDQAKILADLLEVGIEELYEETKKDRQ